MSDNLENKYAQASVNLLFDNIRNGTGPISKADAEDQMDLNLAIEQSTGKPAKSYAVKDFLNRMLSLPVNTQNDVFNTFLEYLDSYIQAAKEDGSFDKGVETVDAISAEIKQEDVIHTDEKTGADTTYLQVDIEKKHFLISWEQVDAWAGDYYTHNQSGKIYKIHRNINTRTDAKTGRVYSTARRVSTTASPIIKDADVDTDYTQVPRKADAKRMWQKSLKDTPSTYTVKKHMLSGALLPIYDRLPDNQAKVQRIILSNGESILGRVLSPNDAEKTLKNFGVGVKREKYSCLLYTSPSPRDS